jgi:hypothetical protein
MSLCQYTGCNERLLYMRYCAHHRCYTMNCSEGRKEHVLSEYCLKHGCLVVNCPHKRLPNSHYCQKHYLLCVERNAVSLPAIKVTRPDTPLDTTSGDTRSLDSGSPSLVSKYLLKTPPRTPTLLSPSSSTSSMSSSPPPPHALSPPPPHALSPSPPHTPQHISPPPSRMRTSPPPRSLSPLAERPSVPVDGLLWTQPPPSPQLKPSTPSHLFE